MAETARVAALSEAAGGLRVVYASPRVIAVTDPAHPGWQLSYGTYENRQMSPGVLAAYVKTAPAGPNRAWFAHGQSLRLIDTEKGIVVRRWRLSGRILSLAPQDGGDSVVVKYQGRYYDSRYRAVLSDRSLTVKAGAPGPVPFPSYSRDYDLARCEAGQLAVAIPTGLPCQIEAMRAKPETLAASLAALRLMARLDPVSPLFQIVLGKLLQDASDPQAREALAAGVHAPTEDYSELFQISVLLDRMREPELATEAFDRGYANFLAAGNEPRLLFNSIYSVYFPPYTVYSPRQTAAAAQLLERVYRIVPDDYAAGAFWRLWARKLSVAGRAAEARVWEARAEETAQNARWILSGNVSWLVNQALLLLIAAVLSALCCLLVMYLRYLPELPKRSDEAARQRGSSLPVSRWLPLACNSPAARWSLLLIVAAGWMAAGASAVSLAGARRFSAMRVETMAGTLGEQQRDYIEKNLPPSPERTLLAAYASQQEGQTAEAERLYRSLPQFAESRNNLGVLLKQSGREQEARSAFEQALRIDRGLDEAAVNLGRTPHTQWAAWYHQAAPDRAMLAPPSRQQMIRAFFRSPGGFVAHAAAGPFAEILSPAPPDYLLDRTVWTLTSGLLAMVAALAVIALAVLALPREAPLEEPLNAAGVLEFCLPGTAKAWGVCGAPVLLCWVYLLAELTVMRMNQLPEVLPFIMQGATWVVRSVGISGGEVRAALYHHWAWDIGGLAVLFVSNVFLVVRHRRKPLGGAAHA